MTVSQVRRPCYSGFPYDEESYCILLLQHRSFFLGSRVSFILYCVATSVVFIFLLYYQDLRWRSEKFLMYCYPVFHFFFWIFSKLSHTLRQPIFDPRFKASHSFKWSNLEVKKKSPLKGAGVLRLKRETIPFMSPMYNCFCSPRCFFLPDIVL